jgi:hypothetical protein
MTEPIDLDAKRKKKADKGGVAPDPERVGKLPKADLYRQVALRMNNDRLAPDWPEFTRRFHYVVDHAGRKAILEETAGGIVVYRDRGIVADAIYNYCWDDIGFVYGAQVDAEQAAKGCSAWLASTPPLPARPAAFLEKSQKGLTFKRLTFDAPPADSLTLPPMFERLMDRTSDPEAICAYIGSLFYPEADRQQYLYLYGEGGDGKGALMRFLHGIFGDAAASLTPPTRFGDKFWNFNVYGKRLGLFYDCEDWNWFGSSHFKSLTGGDPILFEEKGRMGFTDTPSLKFIAASNAKPNISSQASDLRRLIFASFKPLPDGERDVGFEKKLAAEAEAIISVCKAMYLRRCPDHQAIDAAQAKDVAWEAESQYIDIFNSHFTASPECEIPAQQVRQILRDEGVRSNQEVGRVKDVWARMFGVTFVERNKKNYYRGVGFQSSFVVDGGGQK